MSASKAEIAGQIDDVFAQCTSSTGSANLLTIMKTFWPVLDNRVSVVDLAGVFTMSVSSGGAGNEALDLITFADFFNGVARIKYSSGGDYCEKLLQELHDSAGTKIKADSSIFISAADKSVMRTLLKYDMPLRRAFSGFAGQNINVGGGLAWEEVQKLSVGMEVRVCNPCVSVPCVCALCVCVPMRSSLCFSFSTPTLTPSPTITPLTMPGVGLLVSGWLAQSHPGVGLSAQGREPGERCAGTVPA